MNIFKLFTQSGRRGIVGEAFDNAVTVDAITKAVAGSATDLLAKSENGLSIQKSVSIAEYVDRGNDIFQAVIKAAEDKVITQEEAASVIASILAVFGSSLQDIIEKIRTEVISRVP